jgi:hypothetical protein
VGAQELDHRVVIVGGTERPYLLGMGHRAPSGIVLCLHGRGDKRSVAGHATAEIWRFFRSSREPHPPTNAVS